MSKTLKTRPIHVRMFDHKDKGLSLIEVHNHQDGKECNLPPKGVSANHDHIEENGFFHSHLSTICHWQWQYNGHGVCGCNMCVNKFENRWERRKNRHEIKRELHNLARSEDFDDSNI